jgi:hypothetical protein
MLKWIIPVVGAALIGWFLWFQANSTKISYVNGVPPYDVMPGREYILQADCYVFAWVRNPTAGFPLLGTNLASAPTRVAALPADNSARHAGHTVGAVRILDFIPRGTRLLITSVRHEESRRGGIVVTYEAKLLDDIDRPYPKVDLRPLLLPVAHAGDVPVIDSTVAVPWIKR